MITLRKITLENRRSIFNLEVSEEQRQYVASNLSSVASCYVLATNGGSPSTCNSQLDLHVIVGFHIVLITWLPKSYMRALDSMKMVRCAMMSS